MHFAAREWRHWWAVHLRWWAQDTRLLVRRTAAEFLDDSCTHLAAGIAYYVLVSIFPLAILFVSISGLVLTNDAIRADVVNEVFDAVPLSEGEGRADLEDAIDGIASGFSAIGLISIVGLLWSASGVMGAIRHALNEAWDTNYRRPFLRGKLLDLGMIFGAGLLLTSSVASTIFLQIARRVSDDLSDALGPLGAGATGGFEVVAVFVPLLLSFATFLVIFKYVPSVTTHFRHVWPGALFAAILFELLKNGFAFYLRFFGDYDAVYGSLGAVIAFLFFVYLSAVALLLGAEMASEWPRVIHGHYDAELAQHGIGPRGPRWRSALAALTGLVRTREAAPAHISDASGLDVRRRRKARLIEDRATGAAGDESAAGAAGDESAAGAAGDESTAGAPDDHRAPDGEGRRLPRDPEPTPAREPGNGGNEPG